jgi:hypothetical protein
MPDLIFVRSSGSLAGLLETPSCNIVEPTVIKAPQASVLHAAIA